MRAQLPWLARHALLAAVIAIAAAPARASDDDVGGELRLRREQLRANAQGPLAVGDALAPGVAPPTLNATLAEAELRGVWRAPALGSVRASMWGNALLAAERGDGSAEASQRTTQARLNEGFVAGDFDAWQGSAGKKVVAWDVGYGFRPNDVVQQERRRRLLATTQEGRPLVEVERFDAQTSVTLVWVNPQNLNDTDDASRQGLESALATRAYVRDGSADWHAFARWGEHTRASLGAAVAWVATDELEWHASARIMQHHDAWQFDSSAGNAPVAANPWLQATLGSSAQALLGAGWTGPQRVSLLVECWYDGTAPADSDWDAWLARNRALAAFGTQPGLSPALVRAAGGNLAWQATPFATNNLRRNNVFARLAWHAQRWVLSLDALVTPSDRGRVVTAAAQWQGERLRFDAAWRSYGGPADALFSQLPLREVGLLAVSWPF